MSDSIIIWKYLTREYLNSHPVIYLYVKGDTRNSHNILLKVMGDIRIIFCPAMAESYVKNIVQQYLDIKKKQYHRGEIIIKPMFVSPSWTINEVSF